MVIVMTMQYSDNSIGKCTIQHIDLTTTIVKQYIIAQSEGMMQELKLQISLAYKNLLCYNRKDIEELNLGIAW